MFSQFEQDAQKSSRGRFSRRRIVSLIHSVTHIPMEYDMYLRRKRDFIQSITHLHVNVIVCVCACVEGSLFLEIIAFR